MHVIMHVIVQVKLALVLIPPTAHLPGHPSGLVENKQEIS